VPAPGRGLKGWIAMEHVNGNSLLRFYRTPGQPKPSVATVVALLRDVAAELVELHAMGTMHRDLKETNVIAAGK